MNNSERSLSYWRIGTQFLTLAENSCAELVAAGNPHVVCSKKPPKPGEYENETRWSDHRIGIPVLFNFYHGIELLLKGFLSRSLSDDEFRKQHHHQLTRLLAAFERSQGSTTLAQTMARCVRDIDPESPLGKFMNDNSIQIDSWYEALKYPESKGQVFSHSKLKFGNSATVPFWQALGNTAGQLRQQAVKLAHQLDRHT